MIASTFLIFTSPSSIICSRLSPGLYSSLFLSRSDVLQPAYIQIAAMSDPEPSNSEASAELGRDLEQARLFLDDDAVRSATQEKKREFLKTKGFDDTQINKLFDELKDDGQPAEEPSSTTESAPIITYPEFLTTPIQPPPLITPSRLANIVAVTGSLWALVYGTAGLVLSPMVDNLNNARSDYYCHVGTKLDEMSGQLEKVVSKVPTREERLAKAGNYIDDNVSITSDPTELFHRDVGTQTSPPPSVVGTTSNIPESEERPIDVQSRRLAELTESLKEVKGNNDKLSQKTKDLTLLVGGVRETVDEIAYTPPIYSDINFGRSAEPDDEFKKTKDAIRGVKGLFLGSRNFPAVTTTR
ncbi:hypothetical protein F5Y16DRAFT_164066 [Xylariaceae sp. FL0255]|nr:hypothetical protein F5Y16DRAFT_164066 [Xylariaceae sp. FL0255]